MWFSPGEIIIMAAHLVMILGLCSVHLKVGRVQKTIDKNNRQNEQIRLLAENVDSLIQTAERISDRDDQS